MPESKYAHCIIKDNALIKKGRFADSIFSSWDNLKMNLNINYHCITEPLLMIPKPHSHPTYELLCFIGGNPLNIRDFGGEVELYIGDGEDAEKHIINSTSFVVLPPGLVHCPINFKKVDSPFLFMVIFTAGKMSTLEGQMSVVD
jgi:hypothetical protein